MGVQKRSFCGLAENYRVLPIIVRLRDHDLYAGSSAARRNLETIEATSLLTLIQMVESGLGVGLVPCMAVSNRLTNSPRLLARPLSKPCPARTIALVTRRLSFRKVELQSLAEVIRLLGKR